jgi:hypothetical protein
MVVSRIRGKGEWRVVKEVWIFNVERLKSSGDG